MQLPAPIKIGHYKVVFKELPEDYEHEEQEGTEGAWGFYEPKYKQIMLDAELEQHPVLLAEVLIHEVQHAINDVYGIDEDFIHTEEKITTQSSRGWTQVIIDNPHLLEYIKSKLH